MLAPDRTELVAVLVESVIWGAAAITVFRTYLSIYEVERSKSRSLISNNDSTEGHHPTIFRLAPCVLLLLATLHLVMDWYRSIHALTSLPSREAAISFFGDTRHWSFPVRDSAYCLGTLLADAILMIRAYFLWDRRFSLMIPPLACFLGSIVTCVLAIYYEVQGLSLFVPPLSSIITASLIFFTANNLLSTGLIIFRLWRIQTWSPHIITFPVTKLVLETGLIYCLATLATLILFLTGGPEHLVFNSITSLVALLFCTIQITSLDRKKQDVRQSVASPSLRLSRFDAISSPSTPKSSRWPTTVS